MRKIASVRGSVNKVILIGNLGEDPKVHYMMNGEPVTSFNIATTETWRDKSGDTKKEHTEWHRIVVYGKLAEIIAKCTKKGSQIYVDGYLRTRKWIDHAGSNRVTTEIVAMEVYVLSHASENRMDGMIEQRNNNSDQNISSRMVMNDNEELNNKINDVDNEEIGNYYYQQDNGY